MPALFRALGLGGTSELNHGHIETKSSPRHAPTRG